jgi:PII-like signaling protein
VTAGEEARVTVHAGEADRAGDGFLADAVLDRFEAAGLDAAVLLRGAAGFGAEHRLRTDRLLTLSEDLPIVAIGIGERGRIDGLAGPVRSLMPAGLVTVEPVRLHRGPAALGDRAEPPGEASRRLTLVVGRHERAGGRPAHVAVVEALHEAGIDGATVLLGVDGIVGGARRRARFMAANADVPLIVISVGTEAAIAGSADHFGDLLPGAIVTTAPVRVCKRDGRPLADPRPAGDARPREASWQRLTVHHGEQSRSRGRPLVAELVPRLRAAGVAGATSVRGIWGYHGDHAPHGDRLRSLRRRVPVMTSVVDSAERIGLAWEVVDDLTDEAGLVTIETVEVVGPRPD